MSQDFRRWLLMLLHISAIILILCYVTLFADVFVVKWPIIMIVMSVLFLAMKHLVLPEGRSD